MHRERALNFDAFGHWWSLAWWGWDGFFYRSIPFIPWGGWWCWFLQCSVLLCLPATTQLSKICSEAQVDKAKGSRELATQPSNQLTRCADRQCHFHFIVAVIAWQPEELPFLPLSAPWQHQSTKAELVNRITLYCCVQRCCTTTLQRISPAPPAPSPSLLAVKWYQNPPFLGGDLTSTPSPFWRSFRCVFGVPCSSFPPFFGNPATGGNVQKKKSVCERERGNGKPNEKGKDQQAPTGNRAEWLTKGMKAKSLQFPSRQSTVQILFFRISVGCGVGCRKQRQEVKNSHNLKSKRNEVLLKLGEEKGRPVRFWVFLFGFWIEGLGLLSFSALGWDFLYIYPATHRFVGAYICIFRSAHANVVANVEQLLINGASLVCRRKKSILGKLRSYASGADCAFQSLLMGYFNGDRKGVFESKLFNFQYVKYDKYVKWKYRVSHNLSICSRNCLGSSHDLFVVSDRFPRFIGMVQLDINTSELKTWGKRPKNRGNLPKKYGKKSKNFGEQPKNVGGNSCKPYVKCCW